MKNIIKWIIVAALLVGIIVGATVLYEKLSDEYSGQNVTNTPEKDAGENEFAAPDFEVFDENGNKVKLSDFKGKPIVLNFWATWCYYCKVEMPDFDKAFKNYPEVQFLMVNATDGDRETMEKAKEYVEKEGYSFKCLYDTNLDAVSSYYITSFPSTFFIDKNGNLVTRGSGALDYKSLERGISMITGDNDDNTSY